jgi:1-acyl-sn-glycerol-3-phosphate acyltransferase
VFVVYKDIFFGRRTQKGSSHLQKKPTFRPMRRILLILWRIWFYTLAAIPVLVLFPLLAFLVLLPNGYPYLFWIARNIWAPFILIGMGFCTRVQNTSGAQPQKSYLLIANHASYIDPFLMLRAWKTPFVFVGKKELVEIPVFGFIYKRAAIMVDRSDKKSRFAVYGLAEKVIHGGYSVCIFPEKDYVDESLLLNDFKRGAFKMAIEHQLPVLPMVFYDPKRMFPWYTTYGFPGPMRVEIHPPLPTEGLTEKDIPELQQKAHDFIKAKLLADPKQRAVEALAKWESFQS